MRHLYVLLVYAPGSASEILLRRESLRPWTNIHPGRAMRASRHRLRVIGIRRARRERGDVVEHVLHAFTRDGRAQPRPDNVIPMPLGGGSPIVDFIRCQMLIRMFDGDVDRWLRHLEAKGDFEGELRFARWIRARSQRDPRLLMAIRRMVEQTPLWTERRA